MLLLCCGPCGQYVSLSPCNIQIFYQFHGGSCRDSSLRDLRANSGELSRIGSNNEILNSLIKQEREADNSQQIGKDNDENAAPRFQSGVLRTNCIDCLDRTNVAQYAYGLEALGRQLHAMGLTDRPKVDADSSIAAALMDMYQGMGDALAQQYGGSAAHNTVFPERQGKWKATTQSREFLKSIKRYYSNAYTDGEKQDAINLFLGYFQPREGKPALWELDSDYYLHVSGIGDDLIPDYGLSFDGSAVGQGTTLVPVPACREDFLRMKLTSFGKLLERTCCHIKNVRLCSETDQKSGNSGVAPDAVEIQLKSPNWLFGQRKYDDSNSASKVSSHAVSDGASNGENEADGLGDLSWISGVTDLNQEDIFESPSRCWSLLKDLALIPIVGLIATEAFKEPDELIYTLSLGQLVHVVRSSIPPWQRHFPISSAKAVKALSKPMNPVRKTGLTTKQMKLRVARDNNFLMG
ncbi:Phosphoinositide phosphatase SAC1 [Capsicum annuum]|nr:Phosphoinositide phosphatase SAC1 [Capsicum annuum]